MSIRPYPKKKAKPGEKWWVVDVGRGAKRAQLAFEGSYDAAVEFERKLRSASSGANEVLKTDATIRIKNLVEPFLKWAMENLSENTVRDMRFSFDLYLVPKLGNLHHSHLSVTIFHDLMKELREKDLSHTTINKHLNYFGSMIKWATGCNKIPPLGFNIPKFPKKKTLAQSPVEPLTRREVDAIYAKVQPQYRIPFLLMLDHGLRLDEAVSLRIEHIDEHRKILNVIGKGNKRRVVPFMSSRFEQELDNALDGRFSGYLTVSPKRSKKREGDEQPLKTMWKELKRAAEAAGVKRKINHHVLRHTFATLAAETGMNPHALQQILGHASIETTNKIYTKVRQDFIGDEAKLLRERTGK